MKTAALMGVIIMTVLTSHAKPEGSYLRDLTLQYSTPHLNWSEDPVGGKLNALFIVNRIGGREVPEAVQRMGMNFAAVSLYHQTRFVLESIYENSVEGTTFAEKKHELLQKLSHLYDVIVIGNFDFDLLPPEAKFKIIDQVKNGAGLVITYPQKTELQKLFSHQTAENKNILALAAKNGLPEQAAKYYDNDLLTCYRFGKGRIVVINYHDNYDSKYEGLSLTARNSFSRNWYAEYENNLVMLLRSIKFAGGREPNIQISSSTLKQNDILEQKSQIVQFETTVKKNSTVGAELKLRLRDQYNQILKKTANQLKQTENITSFELPFLPAGKYYIDAIATTGNQTDNFGYFSFTIKPAIKAQLNCSTESIRHHAPVKAEIIIDRPLANANLVISLIDLPYNREWYRTTIPIDEKTNIPINISEYYIPTIAGYLNCSIVQNDKTLLKIDKTLFFPDYQLDNYLQMTWTCVPDKYLAPIYAAQIVDRLGWRAGLERPTPNGTNARGAALLNQQFVAYLVRISLKSSKLNEVFLTEWFLPPHLKSELKKLGTDHSFARPEVKQLLTESIKYRIKNLPDYGPALYNLGDENSFSYTSGFGKYDKVAFQQFLEQKYGSIEKLNLEWETSFNSFNNVPHYTLDEAKKRKIYPAWFDHRQYIEKMYADIHHFLAQEIKKYDPDAKVGSEGSVPGNLENSINGLEFWGPYSSLVMDEVLRSIGKEKIRMLWWGGYVGSHGGRNIYPFPLWKDLLTGNVNGSAWFSSYPGKAESSIGADLSFPQYMQKLLPHLDQLKNGLAQLLITTPLQKHDIAILWNHSSGSANLLENKFVNPLNSTGAFINACYRHGINFDFITESMLDKLKNYKILFLFGATSIDKQSAAKITNFVEQGGTVIADMNPGILNEFLRVVKKINLKRCSAI